MNEQVATKMVMDQIRERVQTLSENIYACLDKDTGRRIAYEVGEIIRGQIQSPIEFLIEDDLMRG